MATSATSATTTTLILTVYGAYVRRLGGGLAVAHLIDLLGELGQPAPVVRSATSRMKKAGLLRPETVGGVAGYALTDEARAILDDGDERIFAAQRRAELAEGWIVAVFSVPERRRDHRHQLRRRLVGLGFGQVAPGVWLAPRRVLADARRMLQRLDLADYVTLFAGDHLGFGDTRRLVANTWDLRAIGRAYERFVRDHRRVLDRWTTPPDAPEVGARARAFADYTLSLTAWRRLPYLDPGLPVDLLPDDWPGERARHLFLELVERLDGPALAHVRDVVGAAAPRS
jgi:phenylacetic acid degradation operon negative regulatory protein